MPAKILPAVYRHIWSILCQSSSVDRETNRLSLLNILEEISIKKDKASEGKFFLPLEFEIVSFLERLDDNRKGDIIQEAEMGITDPSGGVLLKRPFELLFRKGFKRLRNRLKMNGLIITTAGIYTFFIRVRGHKGGAFQVIAEIPLAVKISELESPVKEGRP